MADSKLLKEAIADAKAVRETAIENARIALEEAFSPKLQSLVSKKLQAEMEAEDEDEFDYEDVEENVDSSEIGKGDGRSESGTDNKQPAAVANTAHTDLDPETQSQSAAVGHEDSENEKVDDLKETESHHELPDPYDAEYETPEEEEETGVYEEEGFDDEEEFDEDELDLESIIRELEAEIEDDEEEEVDDFEAEPVADDEFDIEIEDDEEVEIELPEAEHGEDYDDEIDLDEILREMGYGDDEDEHYEEVAEADDIKYDELEGELEEAYSTIRELKSTINEVNLLNAKLLYTNKLFRSYELDNSQKVKVVESLDRTSNVREVKLVYSTLAESLKFGGKVASKKVKKITEGLASRPSKSTAPSKEIIQEGNEMADRFKKLAGINK